MKKLNLTGILIAFLVSAIIVGFVYYTGRQRKSLVFAMIPDSTVEWVSLLQKFNTINISVVEKGPFNWENTSDIGQSPSFNWQMVDTDENFIVYYKNDDLHLNVQNARRAIQIANEAIPELEELMGAYPFPGQMNDRKLAIYLPSSASEYSSLINLLNDGTGDYSGTSGMFICHIGPLGCLADGIVLHPSCFNYERSSENWAESVLRHEMSHYVFFSKIDYGNDINHPLWVSEGLAEYASIKSSQIASKDTIDYIVAKCDLYDEFPRETKSEYWAGRSFYQFVEDTKGGIGVKSFINSLYENDLKGSLAVSFGDSVDVKKLWVDEMMSKAGLIDTTYVDSTNVTDIINNVI